MNPAEHITEDDLILLALQFLPEKDLPDALAHVAHCETCREDLGRIQGDLASYAMTAEMHSPPAYARERLMRQIAKEKKLLYIRQGGSLVQAVSSGDGGYSELEKPGKLVTFMPWAGWAVAATMAAVAALQFVSHRHTESNLRAEITQMSSKSARAQDVLETLTDSRAQQVGIHLASTEAKKVPEAHAAYRQDTGSLVFFASRLDPLQPYKTYELWLLPANGREPIAAGIFRPDANGNANVLMPNLPKGVPASGFGVTIEDQGGAKQPTLPIVMSGS